MDLIIVESPTKAKTLSRFLGQNYLIDSTMGHVVDLPKSKLGVDVDHDFQPQYEPVAKRQDIISQLKKDAGQVEEIYLATDPDREGEAISWHVKDVLDAKVKGQKDDVAMRTKFKRIVFHEITESAVKDALTHPRGIDMQLVDAQTARRVLDRLVGYKLSPLLWRKVRKGLSAGRVQSVAVRLIVDKEQEIKAFRPEEYWDIGAELKSEKRQAKSESFTVRLVEKNGKKIKVGSGTQAKEIVADLEKSNYSILSIDKKEVIKRPYAPFTTSTMTQSAARTYFWSAKKTMSTAQKLYEEGLITYHRTDSMHLATQAVDMARNYLAQNFPASYLPIKPRLYKTTSKVAQEAHEAIRPTRIQILGNSEEVVSLGNDAKKLYELVWRRFLASQVSDSVYDETIINVQAVEHTNNYLLQTSGQVVKFDGWKKVYGKLEEAGVQLPEVEQSEALQLIKVNSEQKFTQPPARYSEATLVKTLEKLGIGRPSTYAPTISTIQDRRYVEKQEGRFIPTPVGEAVNDFLVTNFPHIVDYNFTAEMEEDLDEIANGKEEWVQVIKRFWDPFSKKLEGVGETAKRVKIAVEKTGEKCLKCAEGEQVIRVGRFGKFLSCSRFPDCDWSAPYTEKLNMACPGCQKGEVVIKKTRKGKYFYGCSQYPQCKWASWRKPGLDKEKPSSQDEAD